MEYDASRKTSYIRFKAIAPYTGTGRRAASGIGRLRIDGRTREETEFEFELGVSNTEVEVWGGTQYITLDPDEYATAMADIRGITVDLHNGVTITANMLADKKYYGSSAIAHDPLDLSPEIVRSLSLTYTNPAGNDSVLQLGWEQQFYVYDADGAYLGTTQDNLPVARTYYFMEARLEKLELESAGSGSGGGSRGGGSR